MNTLDTPDWLDALGMHAEYYTLLEVVHYREFIKYLIPEIQQQAVSAVNQVQEENMRQFEDMSIMTNGNWLKEVLGTSNEIGKALDILLRKVKEDFKNNLMTPEKLIFISKTLPKLIVFLSPNRKAEGGDFDNQEGVSLAEAFLRIYSNAIPGAMLNFLTPICPPYNYRAKSSLITHEDGQLLPTCGSTKLMNFMRMNTFVFQELLERDVIVNIQMVTYTGEGDGEESLVEMGADVLDYYENNPNEMFTMLRSAAEEARVLISQNYIPNLNFTYDSIELVIGTKVQSLTKDFAEKFRTQIDTLTKLITNHVHLNEGDLEFPADLEIESWLKENLGIKLEVLNFFVLRELAYRAKNFSNRNDGIVEAALNEAFLYFVMQNMTVYDEVSNSNPSIILNMETTADYMIGSLGYRIRNNGTSNHPAHIMLSPANPKNPNSILAMRGPMNPLIVNPNDVNGTVMHQKGMTIAQIYDAGFYRRPITKEQ